MDEVMQIRTQQERDIPKWVEEEQLAKPGKPTGEGVWKEMWQDSQPDVTPRKVCKGCGDPFPMTEEFFHPSPRGNGFRAWCIPCDKERMQRVQKMGQVTIAAKRAAALLEKEEELKELDEVVAPAPKEAVGGLFHRDAIVAVVDTTESLDLPKLTIANVLRDIAAEVGKLEHAVIVYRDRNKLLTQKVAALTEENATLWREIAELEGRKA